MSRVFSRGFTYWLSVFAVGLLVGIGIREVRAWVNPPSTVSPPGGNVFGSVTTANGIQTKEGSLGLLGSFSVGGNALVNGNVGIGTFPNNTKGLSGFVNANDFYVGSIGKWVSELNSGGTGTVPVLKNDRKGLFSGYYSQKFKLDAFGASPVMIYVDSDGALHAPSGGGMQTYPGCGALDYCALNTGGSFPVKIILSVDGIYSYTPRCGVTAAIPDFIPWYGKSAPNSSAPVIDLGSTTPYGCPGG